MKVRQGGFTFERRLEDWAVYSKGRLIGTLVGLKERSGRHCFRLGYDDRKRPRTYRGMVRAAKALRIIDALMQRAKARKWTMERLVIEAWDQKPETAVGRAPKA